MIRMLEIIKNFDVFGRPLHFNFNKQWNTYDTKTGGIFTSLMCLLTLIYTVLLFNIMATHSQNITSTL